ncbi:uracil-DNA glycosylase [Salinarimonas ramus]|uniref:Type-4 uracil-DNA glycosylase n=1 Tax=Salinarimonas ramus TaxID=690164 RepID=A0A917Q8D4_9HYPH|nr:uracil-DNA glycosylase [Salinarimonas ramus]GGK34132.1 uracil-DNA glycosylase [Salinarimonas ramus]
MAAFDDEDLRDDERLREVLIALLDLDVAAGVDCALDETPHDRFAEEAARREEARAVRPAPEPAARREAPPRSQPASPPPARPAVSPGALDPDQAAASARIAAEAAQDLAALEAALAAFEGCALKASARSLVFVDGTPGARVMIVGEAPGADEDRTGKPFVGRAGQLLDRMLAAIGLVREDVYIANVVPWRPPGNRTPTPQEVAACLPFTRRQIALADPDILVCMGAPATQHLLGVREGITKARGRWLDYDTGRRTIRALPMLHPAYLLRQPLQKRLAWRDLRALRAALRQEDSQISEKPPR